MSAPHQLKELSRRITTGVKHVGGSPVGVRNNLVGLRRIRTPTHALLLAAMLGPTIKTCAADTPVQGRRFNGVRIRTCRLIATS